MNCQLSLVPSAGGLFEAVADGVVVWHRKDQKGFPEITELKQVVRDVIAPDKLPGHSGRKKHKHTESLLLPCKSKVGLLKDSTWMWELAALIRNGLTLKPHFDCIQNKAR